MKIMSSRLRLLCSYINATSPVDLMKENSIEEKCNDNDSERVIRSTTSELSLLSVVPRTTCIAVLEVILHSAIFKDSLRSVLTCAFVVDRDAISCDSDKNKRLEQEATECALVNSFLSTLWALLSPGSGHVTVEDDGRGYEISLINIAKNAFSIIVDILDDQASCKISIPSKNLLLARLGWLNSVHFSIGKFLASIVAMWRDSYGTKSIRIVQSFILALIGRLRRGEEAMAAILFSQDAIFSPSSSIVNGSSLSSSGGAIQRMMMEEICKRSKQLDHSFKLMGGPGIIASGKGPFALESLRSEADYVLPVRSVEVDVSQLGDDKDVRSESDSFFLPLDKVWLWQILSSTVDPMHDVTRKEEILNSSTKVVVSCFQLLISIEKENIVYAKQIDAGTKMYHLFHSCLFPEGMIRDNEFSTYFLQLHGIYCDLMRVDNIFSAKSFIRASFHHSIAVHVKNKSNFEGDNTSNVDSSDSDQEKVLAIFNKSSLEDANEIEVLPKEMRSFDDFVADLCTAFIDYGAQYEPFIHAIRFLMRPGFPTKVRINILTKLGDLLHLLTTENEFNNKLAGTEILMLLKDTFSGGLPIKDGSKRDPAEFLDTLAVILKRGSSGSHAFRVKASTGGIFYLLAVGYLGRNLASSSLRCECGVKAMKRRMSGMDETLLCHIVSTAIQLIRSQLGTIHELATNVILVCVEEKSIDSSFAEWRIKKYDDDTWNTMISSLREAYNE